MPRTSIECVCLLKFTPHKHFQHCPACHRTKEERKSESPKYGRGQIHHLVLARLASVGKSCGRDRVKHTIKALEIKEFQEQALHSNFSFRTTGGSCFSSQQEVPFLFQRLPLHILPSSFSLPSPEQPRTAAQLVCPSSSFLPSQSLPRLQGRQQRTTHTSPRPCRQKPPGDEHMLGQEGRGSREEADLQALILLSLVMDELN